MKIKSLIFFVVLVCSLNIQARKLMILHTNDLHSYFESLREGSRKAGYAKIKTLIKFHKNKAQKEGIPSIVLDAGDFSEGNIFYMSSKGYHSFKMMDHLGYDAVTLGNHDFLMGNEGLDELLSKVRPNYSLLSANLVKKPYYYHSLKEYIKPFREFNFNGLKVAVLGLTTSEILYKWRLKGCKLSSPIKVGAKMSKHLKINRGNHFVVALTHIGFKDDKKLASKAPHIDLIVGGHSHTLLSRPEFIKKTPIVQVGEHGEFIGKMIVDINLEDGSSKLLSYQLIDVNEIVKPDPFMQEKVKMAREDLNQIYGESWLAEVLGFSEVEINNSEDSSSYWGHFISKSMHDSTPNADMAIHLPPFSSGDSMPAGTITREDLIQSYPRFFELEEKMGWSIWKAKMSGAMIRLLIRGVIKFEEPLFFSGITFKLREIPYTGELWVYNMRINGQRILPWKRYSVALPEGIVRGAYAISHLTKIILKQGHETPYKMWTAMENRLRKIKVIKGDIRQDLDSYKKYHFGDKTYKVSEKLNSVIISK